MIARGFRGKCRVFLMCCCMGFNVAFAQVGIGTGFEYGTPIIVGNSVFARRPSLGLSAVLSCQLPHSRVFPSFSFLNKRIQLPVTNARYKDLADEAREDNFVLNLNYKANDKQHYTLFFLGIGMANIVPGTSVNDEFGNTLDLRDTGSRHQYPLVQVGCKYMHRILPNSNFYLGMEANMKYIRLASDNSYYIVDQGSATKASISGTGIFPGVEVHLEYVFRREGRE